MSKICSIEGCGKPYNSRGLCAKHYTRLRRHGSSSVTKSTEPGSGLRFIEDVAVNFEGDDCLPWPFGPGSRGYGSVKIRGRGKMAHRVVCEIAHGPPPIDKPLAAHSCGNGHLGCVNPNHLRWASYQENSDDAVAHGAIARGERNGSAKITEEIVRKIFEAKGSNTQKAIGAAFGVSKTTVGQIHRGTTWKCLQEGSSIGQSR